MKKFDAIVVGAGSGGNIGALALQKSGKKTLLIEKHNITGGTGSSFRRGRFEFETALHQLYGITDDYKGEPDICAKYLKSLEYTTSLTLLCNTKPSALLSVISFLFLCPALTRDSRLF